MATIKLDSEDIFDFKEDYKLAKYPPKDDGYYMTVKYGLGGIYTTINEWKNGKWMVLATDDSDVIAYSREQVSKEDVKEWANAKLEEYKKNLADVKEE